MITRLHLKRFKAFQEFRVSFGAKTILVGPNSAGKSTIIASLRTSAAMVRYARARKPDGYRMDGANSWLAYDFDGGRFDLDEENLRYEFHNEADTRVQVAFEKGAQLTAFWPAEDLDADDDSEVSGIPHYRLTLSTRGERTQPRGPGEVKRMFPSLAVIPPLTPLDQRERLLEPGYVKANLSGRLSSRHFRNQLRLLDSQELGDSWDSFMDFCSEWLPEVSLEQPALRYGDPPELDIFYREGRTPKELAWAGDGYQVFLQLLLHLFRNRGADTLILDEPDLYLHADLQRRLLQVLDSIGPQVILATHSSELLVEASSDSIVWVDKSRKRAVSTPDLVRLGELSRQIGTRFNLRLAKALRSSLALFVEGQDMRILQELAGAVGAERLRRERDLALIPIEGFSNWRRLEGFGWLVDKLLEGSIKGFIILDRDYHSDADLEEATKALGQSSLRCHIWQRKELENYLIVPSAIARLSGADSSWVEGVLDEVLREMKQLVLSRLQSYEIKAGRRLGEHDVSILERVAVEFEESWDDEAFRVARAPGKKVLETVNRRLQEQGHRPVSSRALAKSIRSHELSPEMINVLLEVEGLLASA